MIDIVKKTIDWNAERFEQRYNYDMAVKLILEESEELFAAQGNEIEIMDAVGDIVFVAIGNFWKMGFTHQQIHAMLYDFNLAEAPAIADYNWKLQIQEWIMDHVPEDLPAAYPVVELSLNAIFMIAIPALRGIGMQSKFYDVCHAICDSNNTKAIKKTAHTEKANIDKGTTFIPPTDTLIKLWQERN